MLPLTKILKFVEILFYLSLPKKVMARKLGLVAGQNSIFFTCGTLFNGITTKKPK